MRIQRPLLPLAGAAALVLASWTVATANAATVRVFAAASLTEVVEEVARVFDGARVVSSVAGSGALARQIADGAPADVLISASPSWIEYLRAAELLDGAPVLVARNRLVCIAPDETSLAARSLSELVDRLERNDRVAIADAGVPAGEYARSALAHVSALETLESKRAMLVGLKDVRAVLRAVERGEVTAGFVYATDVPRARVRTLFTIDRVTHPPIEYWAAVLGTAAEAPAARELIEFLQGPAGRTILEEAGFGPGEPMEAVP